MSWAVIQSRSSLRTSLLDSCSWSRAQLKLARFHATKLMPSSPMSSSAQAGSASCAHHAMYELPPATNTVATVYITIVTTAINWRTRKAALKAITESSSKCRWARAAVPNALMRRMAPKVSWMVEVTSDVAAR